MSTERQRRYRDKAASDGRVVISRTVPANIVKSVNAAIDKMVAESRTSNPELATLYAKEMSLTRALTTRKIDEVMRKHTREALAKTKDEIEAKVRELTK